MNMDQLTNALYRFVARLDDDAIVPRRIQEHAHLLRQEIEHIHPTIRQSLPPTSPPTS